MKVCRLLRPQLRVPSITKVNHFRNKPNLTWKLYWFSLGWTKTKSLKKIVSQIHRYPNFHFCVIKTTFYICAIMYARYKALFAIKNSYLYCCLMPGSLQTLVSILGFFVFLCCKLCDFLYDGFCLQSKTGKTFKKCK